MKTKVKLKTFIIIGSLLFVSFTATVQTVENKEDKGWIEKSNSYTQMLLDLEKKYSPEYASSQGLAEYDTSVSVPTIANQLAKRKEQEQILSKYRDALKIETNRSVVQDLNILIKETELDFKRLDFELRKKVPFFNAASSIYEGLQILLDEQTPESRRAAAVVRIQKYAGLKNGYRPLTILMQEWTQQQMAKKDMIFPAKEEMEVELSRNESIMNGIPELCKKYNLHAWEQPFTELKKQVDEYNKWLKTNLLPKARTDFRLHPDEYKLELLNYGIDIEPGEVAKMAHEGFKQIQEEMQTIAAQIAKQRKLSSYDYRVVIRELKKEQVVGDNIVPLYEKRLKEIEAIIEKNKLLTLPSRPAIIRLATEAETAQTPAPHMLPPPFLNNTGQRGVFVLPLNMPPAPGEKEANKFDDFTFDAASWTLTAHEARPGHELQFDKMVEEGVSLARVLYAFNSTNAEGWGLYSEYILKPFMPLEGQLISLQYRLLRAARAFLDPELQSGKITKDHAMKVLLNDVVQSKAFAQQEVERYTFNAPGQANSYFYGFAKMIELRKDAEKALGKKFDTLKFHDFILSQGLLPPNLIREAVMNDFVEREKR